MMPTNTWYKMTAIVAALIFGLMAAIQYNDPDPLYWIVVYAAVAAVAVGAAIGRSYPRFTLLTLGAVFAGALIAVPGFIDWLQSGNWGAIGEHMNDEEPYIEEGREFIGLLMAAAALWWLSRRRG